MHAPLISRRSRIGAAAALAAITGLLCGCSGPAASPSTPVVAPPTSTASASAIPSSAPPTSSAPSPSPSSASPSASSSPVAAACSDLTSVPAGASTTHIVDGARETLFLTTSAPWCLGVRTASRVFAIADPLQGTGRHSVWGLGTDGGTGRAVVLDDGVTALVYRLQDSGLQQLRAASGGPLAFPVGRTATGGTGVACNDQNGGILIERSTAVRRSDGTVDVQWATVSQVSEAGVATVSAPETRYSGLAAGDARVAQAATSHCGQAPDEAHATH